MSQADKRIGLDEAVSIVCADEESQSLCIDCIERQAMEIAIQKTAALMDRKEDRPRILVIVPNRNAKLTFMHEWMGYADGSMTHPRVYTIEEVCRFVLDETDAEARFGRKLERIDELGMRVLVEDMKVLGLKPHRLEDMLEYMYRGLSEMLDQKEGWLISEEETMVFEELRRCLVERDAVLPCELGGLAIRAIEESALPPSCRADYVVVLGFTAMTASQQLLCRELASKQLVAFGNSDDQGVSCNRHPHPAGLSYLAERAGARRISLMSADRPVPDSIEYASAEDELDGVVQRIVHDAANREDGYRMVVCPNKAWLRRFQGEISDRGVKTQALLEPLMCFGDPRKADDGSPLDLYAALSVIARPDSVLSWRAWIGLGDYLCMSNVWRHLRVMAVRLGMSAGEHLLAIAQGGAELSAADASRPGFERLKSRLEAGRELIARCEGLTGYALLEAIADCVGFEGDVSEYVGVPIEDTCSARLMHRRLQDAAADPMPNERSKVVVATQSSARGLLADHVFITGLIDGFVPSKAACDVLTPGKKRERMLEREAKTLAACSHIASKTCCLTSFTELGLEQASILGADIDRIFLRSGSKRARVKTSRYLSDPAHAFVPDTRL